MDDDLPMDTSRDVFYFTEGALAYAGYYLHSEDNPAHTHTFVEIAFVIGGEGTHHCAAGRRTLQAGDVMLLRPGVWHGYENCTQLELYNCCFSAELLRRELAWTREDPLLGYLLWTGPYSAPGRGALALSLDATAFGECLSHLEALTALRHCPLERYRGDVLGRLSLLLSTLGRVAQGNSGLPSEADRLHPAVSRAIRMLEADIARRWSLTSLAAELHLHPGYLVRVFKAATGLPPMAYLAQVRAEQAAVLLLHSDQPITGIGHAVGWSDQNYFARRFKAHYGLTATTYRARFATRAAHLHGGHGEQAVSGGVAAVTPPADANSA
jgi:AraC family transcriptional regulator, L-rhamnose operon transcriptional activator RhaR